jgi:hypothetical protein
MEYCRSKIEEVTQSDKDKDKIIRKYDQNMQDL